MLLKISTKQNVIVPVVPEILGPYTLCRANQLRQPHWISRHWRQLSIQGFRHNLYLIWLLKIATNKNFFAPVGAEIIEMKKKISIIFPKVEKKNICLRNLPWMNAWINYFPPQHRQFTRSREKKKEKKMHTRTTHAYFFSLPLDFINRTGNNLVGEPMSLTTRTSHACVGVY